MNGRIISPRVNIETCLVVREKHPLGGFDILEPSAPILDVRRVPIHLALPLVSVAMEEPNPAS